MAPEESILSEDDSFHGKDSQKDWKKELFLKLRDDLIVEIDDNTIYSAIENYRQFVLGHMLRTGEIERVGSESSSRFSQTIWRMNDDETDPKLIKLLNEIDEQEVDIILPEAKLYNDIITHIWKKRVNDPTWSLEYSLVQKQ